jgi:hypothetical protein
MIFTIRATVLADALFSFLEAAIGRRPGVRPRTARWWSWLPGPWRRAHITLGWTLWLAEGTADLLPGRAVPLLAHEGTHWLQRHRWGRWGFGWRYVLPWGRARIEAEAYAVEAAAYNAMIPGEANVIIEEMGDSMGGWLYLLGKADHAARIRAHYANPAPDLAPWLGMVARAAHEAAR